LPAISIAQTEGEREHLEKQTIGRNKELEREHEYNWQYYMLLMNGKKKRTGPMESSLTERGRSAQLLKRER